MARKPEVRIKVHEFICTYKEENDGLPPTYQQIADHFGWAAPANAWDHVQGLERDGLVKIDKTDRKYRVIDGEYYSPLSKAKVKSAEPE